MKRTVVWVLCLCVLAAVGCNAFRTSGSPPADAEAPRVLVLPFENLTETPHAGEAVAELMATEMLVAGMPLIRPEQREALLAEAPVDPLSGRLEADPGDLGREAGAARVVTGAVTELHYRSGLSANPAVGCTVTVLDTASGEVVWTGSGSRSGLGYGSLTGAAQKVCRQLVKRMRKALPR